MPVYKEAIAHSSDEGWMLQDLYVLYAENVVIDAFQIRVTEGCGVPTGHADTPSTAGQDRSSGTSPGVPPSGIAEANELGSDAACGTRGAIGCAH
jgi:hypothetical protein